MNEHAEAAKRPETSKGGRRRGGWQRLEIINKIMNVGNDFLK